MGIFGTGLYAGDFALDLRTTVGAVARLPFDADRLAEIVCETEPGVCGNPANEDYTTFWLVVADQFAKRGIASERVRERALAILDAGDDLAMREKLGEDAAGLKKRRKVLEEVRQRIVTARPRPEPREVMKKPQELLMDAGDVVVFPTFGGRCRNPYFVDQEKDRTGTATPAWRIDSWAALVVVACGRAFDFLAWYRPVVTALAMEQKPDLAELRKPKQWALARAGTSSAAHFQRMQLEKIGRWRLDEDKVREKFPAMRPGIAAAVSDISIANGLHAGPPGGKPRERKANDGVLESIGEILADA